MSAELRVLVEAQHDIHGRMSRSVDNLRKMGVTNITLGAIQARLTILDNLWGKIEAQHELIRTALKDKYSESEYSTSEFIDAAENTYVTQRSTLLGYADRLQGDAPTASTAETHHEHALKTSLPRIKLQTFSGAYGDWPAFRDIFLSIIGDNRSISDIEKLHYLRTSLQGPAEKLIKSLPIVGGNYERAWSILSTHYENKRELIRATFAAYTAVPRMRSATAGELSRIFNAATTAINAQESIGRPIDTHGMDLFNYLLVERFDPQTRMEWESSIRDTVDPPSSDVLMSFVAKQILTLNAVQPIAAPSSGGASRSAKSHVVRRTTEPSACAVCHEKHSIMQCAAFKAKTASERKALVEANKLCFNCLGNHLMAKCQSAKTCFTCKSRHHTLLHDAYATPSQEVNTFSTTSTLQDQKATLLATARVTLTDRLGRSHDVRALLDQGSEVSLVSENLAQRLRLPRTRTSMSIIGVGGAHSGSTRGRVTLDLKSRITKAPLTVVAYVLPLLSSYQGPSIQGSTTWPHIHGLTLADPQYLQRDPIHLLLGADAFSSILLDGLRKGRTDQPIAQKTKFGWLLSGGCGNMMSTGSFNSLQCTIDHDLNALVQRFWEQEREQPASTALTPDEERCEEIFARTHERSMDGRYTVRLPLTGSPPPLDHTRVSAERLLAAMERRRSRDSNFNQLYCSFMEEYANLKHMTLVKTTSTKTKSVCYLPHHGVLRSSSTTTKLRVVFNGSQRTSAGISLNSNLLVGANLLPTLSDVLLRWRWHRFVFIADIEKMYRQILVHPDDRDLQRILWRQQCSDDVQEYRLNTVTYGLACAPFLAIRTLRQLADDEESENPKGANALRRDCYVDDIVTGSSTLSEAVEIQRQLRRLCMAGGFPLRKWASNHEDILQDIPREQRLQQPCHDWEDEVHPTLGLQWHPHSDSFTFRLQPRMNAPLTKRQVLSETARIFDPLGWLTPVIARAKILIQSAWMKHLDWDTPLPQSDEALWRRLLEDLSLLEQLRLERWLGADHQPNHVELHGFADASERGYAAVLYLRVISSSFTKISLLAAKSKVAPIKPVSVPRLELCAAVLVTNLTFHLRKTLDLISAPVTLWSDSSVTLQWIQGHASKWKTFVANRVSHIQTKLPEARWRHIPGRDNPADCASRGVEPRDLLNHSLWWTGPSWLYKDSSLWPMTNYDTHDELPETRALASHSAIPDKAEAEMLLRFSDLHRLLRVTAWCCRWRGNPPSSKAHLNLTSDELEAALLRWLRVVQAYHFSKEITALKQNRTLVKGQLSNLSPFIDNHGVIRVGGRLKHAVLSDDERHPIILPPESWMTQLLVKAHHKRTLHGGVQLTLGLLRLRYWIPRGRSIVKRTIHRCVTCARWKAAVPRPMMSSLPTARVAPARPFLRTGVDYAGPILIRTGKGRGHKSHKGFIAVFVCFSTKAVHLEAASDCSTDAFLAAFRRFISRRGLCEEVYSDCGTNFVGASRELRLLFQASSSEGRRIAHTAASDGIRWRFNPPAAPHFGGLWEAAVKSTKHHLRRVLGDTTLTFEEISTFLTQVEACLNSRPLQALSDDHDDITALTPGHFLIGAPLLAVPEPSLADSNVNLLSRWKLLQRMRDHFWERWSREYINSLASRPKWLKDSERPTVGALCLLRSDITPPTRWPLARITALHPGGDGVTRVVTIRTASSELTRPLAKIVLLPGADAAPQSPPSDSRARTLPNFT